MSYPQVDGGKPNFYSYTDTDGYMPHHITISKLEYDALLQIARDHETLKSALYSGGVAPETLDILINANIVPREPMRKDSAYEAADWASTIETSTENDISNGASFFEVPGRDYASTKVSLTKPSDLAIRAKQAQATGSKHASSASRERSASAITAEDDDYGLEGLRRDSAAFSMYPELGTLHITGLSDLVTHRDLTDIIRGGSVISLTIHHKDRTAVVTMLEGAAEFLAHVKRYDLYVQSKRLEVRWSARQFQLSKHVQRQIQNGATRNLVIRNGARLLTEKAIRDHMEHIEKLVIIDVVFRGLDIYLYTNSVHCALFARTCMLSRKAYRNLRIEHFPDDCADRLPEHLTSRSQHLSAPSYRLPLKSAATNMFKVLDDFSDSTSEDDDDLEFRRMDDDDATVDESDGEGVRIY